MEVSRDTGKLVNNLWVLKYLATNSQVTSSNILNHSVTSINTSWFLPRNIWKKKKPSEMSLSMFIHLSKFPHLWEKIRPSFSQMSYIIEWIDKWVQPWWSGCGFCTQSSKFKPPPSSFWTVLAHFRLCEGLPPVLISIIYFWTQRGRVVF